MGEEPEALQNGVGFVAEFASCWVLVKNDGSLGSLGNFKRRFSELESNCSFTFEGFRRVFSTEVVVFLLAAQCFVKLNPPQKKKHVNENSFERRLKERVNDGTAVVEVELYHIYHYLSL